MKKRVLIITLIGLSFGMNAQITELPNGNVGIGTTTPSQKLHIVTENEGVNYLMHLGGKTHLSGNAFGIGFNPEGWYNGYGNRIKTAIVVEGNNTGWGRGNLHILQNNNANMLAATLSDAVFTVTPLGNVGIGISSPTSLLTLRNSSLADNAITGSIDLTFATTSTGIGPKISGYKETFNTAGLAFFTQYGYSTPVEKMRINGNGNVGIGTTSPEEIFEIKSSNPVATFHSPGIASFKIGNDGNVFKIAAMDNGFGGHRGNFNANDSQTISMKTNGNVGIGTINPDSKLTVAGNIHSQEVKVTINAGADFVFNKDYNLPSLESVAKYVKENNHLPEIASEKEMKENGLLLAEMNIKLLQKIEELTLYTIQQEKKINNLEKQNSRIENLEKEIKSLKSISSKFIELQKRMEKLEKK